MGKRGCRLGPNYSADWRYRIDTGRANLIRLFRFLELFIFFAEALNASGRIDQFLFAGKKRMTFRAYFDAYVLFGGTDLNFTATGALNGRFE